jgi:hypothetical protein
VGLPNKSTGPEYVGEGVGDSDGVGDGKTDGVGDGKTDGVGDGKTDGVGDGFGLALDWLAVPIEIPALQIKLCFFF